VASADFKSVGPAFDGSVGGFNSLALPPFPLVGGAVSSSSEEFVYHGSLAKTALPEMLATIHRYGVPGEMECTRGEERKRVYFYDGDINFATTTNRQESLGDFLLRQGKITKAQYDISSAELVRSKGTRRHGSILVEMNFLKPNELGAAVREQVQAILWSLFNWEDGDVTFRVGRFCEDEVFKIHIPTPRAVLAGCKRIADAKLLTSRLGGRSSVFRTLECPEHLSELKLEVGEQKLLELVDGKTTLVELCKQGPLTPGLNARVLYGLAMLGLVEHDKPQQSGIRIHVRGDEEERKP